MAVRVLLALGADPTALAEALRAAGHALEVCSVGRLASAVAAFAPAAGVVEIAGPRLPVALVELARAADRPALVALLGPSAGRLAAETVASGIDAALPLDAPREWVVAAVESAFARRALLFELARWRARQLCWDAVALLGPSAAARRLREGLERVSSTPRTTVLVTGAAGSGLEAVARLIHSRSARSQGPLVEVDCGDRADADAADALSASGYLHSRAEGGTLVLHQVLRLGPLGQLALVQALARGDEGTGAADVRVVATSSGDWAEEVRLGRLREDLLYRLNVLNLRVPPLVERREDLGEIARGLLKLAQAGGRPPARLDLAGLERLLGHSWPGGLDQLRLTLELALLTSPGPELSALTNASASQTGASGDLGGHPTAGLGTPGVLLRLPDRRVASAEEALIRQVLAETGGNKLRSAELLGIHRTTLYHKLQDYGIEP